MSEFERFEEESAKSFDAGLARRLLSWLRPYKARATFSVVLIILASILPVASPVIVAVAIDLYVLPPEATPMVGVSQQASAWLDALGVEWDRMTGIQMFALLYLAVMIVNFGLKFVQMIVMNMMGQYVMYDIRREIFKHLQRLDVRFFDRNPVGRLITRMTTDVEALNEMFTAGFVSIFGDVFVLTGIVIVLFWMDWRLALVLFAILPFIVLISLWFRRGARKAYRRVRVRIAAINAFLQEHLSGIATVQLFNREREEAAKFDDLNARHRNANLDSITYYAIFYPGVELIQSIGIALVVWYGGGQVLQGALSIGALVAFFQYVQRFYEPISDLSEKYNILQAAMAASERIFRLLDTKASIEGPEDGVKLDSVDTIEFRNVWFAYNDEEWVLEDISFRVGRGEHIALVGHTGAGKTTVTNLLLRLYDIQKGSILINGIDIREIDLDSLRRLFAIVQQDVFLFSGTVGENISLNDQSISPERVREVSERVWASRFIERLPAGYDAELKERGGGLSSGEKQLLSFARALAFDPPVLILDEATSSIDTETEALIQHGIEVLMEGRTSIAIAHRLSTIRSSDAILVFHHGRIRERGTHDELIAHDGLYRKLYELQYREEHHADLMSRHEGAEPAAPPAS
ncbi:MAG: ABC transporter ATP-binding protein [Thermoanaerobaculia bacterium]|nr:ABC transporter ATP-binding protein [Thermoanaerobaculia bacterium]